MFVFKRRKEREIQTVKTMIRMYCKAHHHPEGEMCEECAAVFSYAAMKYLHCMFGEEKPVCTVCPVHCYRPEMREKIRVIMRYSGPRMICRHPIMAVDHLILQFLSKRRMDRYLRKVKKIRRKKEERKAHSA